MIAYCLQSYAGPDRAERPRWAGAATVTAVGHDLGMTLVGDTGADLVAAMSDIVIDQAEASEQARTITAPIIDAMWDNGLMRYLNPAAGRRAEPRSPR